MPMYVVVMTLALADVVVAARFRAGISPAVLLKEAEVSEEAVS